MDEIFPISCKCFCRVHVKQHPHKELVLVATLTYSQAAKTPHKLACAEALVSVLILPV